MKPMLAGRADLKTLRYPLIASPKLDGVRCVIIDGVAMSRNLKPIPNTWVQRCIGRRMFNGLDGELTVGPSNAADVFQVTQSAVMSVDGRPEVTFSVFDSFLDPTLPYEERRGRAAQLCQGVLLPHHREFIEDEGKLVTYEVDCLIDGYEGIMLRDPHGRYKFGRSTTNEGLLLKLKRFEDAEAVVLGCLRLCSNTNPLKLNELGQLRRSSHKVGMVERPLLGALAVRDVKTGVEFEVGTGFTQVQRHELWPIRGLLAGKIIKYKYQAVGVKDKPRFPVFLGFRDEIDA